MFNTSTLANSFLERSFADKKYMSAMKLQRLVYIANSECLKNSSGVLTQEHALCWSYGPVFYSIYNYYSCLNGNIIKKYMKTADGKSYVVNDRDNPLVRYIIDTVWTSCKDYSPKDLSNILRVPGSAWDKAFQAESQFLETDDIANDISYCVIPGMDITVTHRT